MKFLERVATTELDVLVAELAKEFLACAKTRVSMNANIHTTYKQARENRARFEAMTEELRDVWRAAYRCDAIATDLLKAFALKYRHLDQIATHRMLLVAAKKNPTGPLEYTVKVMRPDGTRAERTFWVEDDFINFMARERVAVLSYTTPGGEDAERLDERIALALAC